MEKMLAIRGMTNKQLENAYNEMRLEKLPAAPHSIIRALQNELYKDDGVTYSIISIKHKVAMEYISRLIKK